MADPQPLASGPEAPATSPKPIREHEVTSVPTTAKQRVFVGTGLFWGLAVGVALAVAMIILAAQNTARTTISFLGSDMSTPVIVVILATLLVGVVLDELFGLVYRVGRRRTLGDRDHLERLELSEAAHAR